MESPEINPHTYGYLTLFLTKEARIYKWAKIPTTTQWCWVN